VLADRRYDALIDRDAPQFDLVRAGQARVADLRARAILSPDVLETQVELVAALLSIGENEDALALVDEIVASATAAKAGKHPGYRDAKDQLPWAYNYAATALVRLGRHDAAVDYLRRGTMLDESGAPNVSQTLNLGQLYNNLGRHEEALDTVDSVVANMSTIGRMVQANARLRAALDTGDRQGADAAMAFLRANRDESPGILFESLVEAGDLDEAAAEVIAMLESPEDRAEALAMLQPFAEGPDLPGEKRYNDHWRRLEDRDDVKAAVERVGRILPPLPVHGTF
jgi:tetratricopeptide (TPR) repeat protein